MNKNERIRLQKCIDIADVKPNEIILDLGCGHNTPLTEILGSDINYIGIDKTFGNDLEIGLPSDIKNNRFDIIFMNEFIEHIENFRSLLIECRDVLSEIGRIIISTPSNNRILAGEDPTHIHCFRKTNIHNLAKICDLKVIAIKGTYIRFPPISPMYISIPTNQTIYTEVIVYRLEKNIKNKNGAN